MANREPQLDRLTRRLRLESAGPMAAFSNQATSVFISAIPAIVAWIRRGSEKQPLITMLLVAAAGLTIGRMGHNDALR